MRELELYIPEMRIAIVVPTLDEARILEARLRALGALRAIGHRVIVSDGGSRDSTVELAMPLADDVIACPPGRARLNQYAGCNLLCVRRIPWR